MARTQKFPEDLLLEAVIKYAEAEKRPPVKRPAQLVWKRSTGYGAWRKVSKETPS